MATYRIKQGESLKLRYAVDDIDDLEQYTCNVQIVREDAEGDDCDMVLTADRSAFEGNIEPAVTELLAPKMYLLLVLISNVSAEDPLTRQFEIHDKLIVEEGGLYQPVSENPA